jgi:hypothetical protein
MAYVNLTNTSGQVDVALRCSYDRLIKNFVGPLTENACANSNCGFLIQDGNKNTGIFVANCSIQFCKNKIELKQDVNASIILPANRCLTISGNGSVHAFSCDGTVSFGDEINPSYNGIQSYHPQPSLVLKDTDQNVEHAIRFLNCENQESFLICQTDTFTCLTSTGNLIFKSSGNQDSFHISGSNVSISGSPNTGYGFLNYSNSLFCGESLFLNNICLSGIARVSTNSECTGLYINTRSVFFNEILICSGFCVCNSNISTSCCITGSSGFFNSICSYLNVNTEFVNTSGLCVCGGNTNISGTVSISGNTLISGFSNFNSTTFVNSTGRNLILTSGAGVSGDLRLTGALLINPIGLGVNSDHVICGKTITINSTGIGENLNSILGNTILSGNLNVTGSGVFNNICSTGNINNLLSGSLTVGDNLFSCKGILADNITGSALIFSQSSISGCFISGSNLFQSRSDTTTCFLSTGLNIGTNCIGAIGAANTSKAWGRISLIDGIQRELLGYNIKSHQVYGTAATIVVGTTIYAHGICFCQPIKYPFSINFNVYASGNPIITGHSSNIKTNEQLGFSGAATSTTVGNAWTLGSNWGVSFYALSGKCSATCLLAPYTVGSSYSEIYFNLMNCKGPTTPYSELTGAAADGIINFTIFGS